MIPAERRCVIANTIEILIRAQNQAGGVLREALGQLDQFATTTERIGQRMVSIGSSMTAFTAPIVAGLAIAASQFMSFDAAATNAAAVLGKSRDQMAQITDEIKEIAEISIAGPQAVIEAYYEVVSGVADATTHMAILEAAVRTSEAGAASLTGTTAALISVMNSYSFGADQAARVSDILTRTVQLGVGSMDQFSSSFAVVTGTAAAVGVSFEEVAASTAFLTTKGFSASVATTALNGAITALLNPSKEMSEALAAIGQESGSSALENLGLAGTYQRLYRSMGNNIDRMQTAVGQTEAMRAVMGLTADNFNGFVRTFTEGMEGATEAARTIQLDSLAADMALFRTEASMVAIDIGEALAPMLRELAQAARAFLNEVRKITNENPEMVRIFAVAVTVIAGLGVVLTAVGFILPAISAGIGLVSGALAFLVANPIVLAIAAVVALAAAWATNFMGIRDTVELFGRRVEAELALIAFQAGYHLGRIWSVVQPALQPIVDFFLNLWGTIDPALQPLIGFFVLAAVQSGLFTTGLGLLQGALALVGSSALGATIIGIGPFAGVLLLIGGMFLAYQTNALGFRDSINNVRSAMEDLYTTGQDLIPKLTNAFEDLLTQWGLIQAAPLLGPNTRSYGMPSTGNLFGPRYDMPDQQGAGGGSRNFRANGGSVMAGRPYIVGEQRPELFIPNSSGRIEPSVGGGGATYNLTIQLPAEALASPERARAMGEAYGDGIMGQIRTRGGLG